MAGGKGKKNMTKRELMKKFDELQEKKRCHIEGIYWNSRKDEIENAICCLEASDEYLDDCLTVVKMKYHNIYNTVVNNGDWKRHSFNRLYIYNTARLILAS